MDGREGVRNGRDRKSLRMTFWSPMHRRQARRGVVTLQGPLSEGAELRREAWASRDGVCSPRVPRASFRRRLRRPQGCWAWSVASRPKLQNRSPRSLLQGHASQPFPQRPASGHPPHRSATHASLTGLNTSSLRSQKPLGRCQPTSGQAYAVTDENCLPSEAT